MAIIEEAKTIFNQEHIHVQSLPAIQSIETLLREKTFSIGAASHPIGATLYKFDGNIRQGSERLMGRVESLLNRIKAVSNYVLGEVGASKPLTNPLHVIKAMSYQKADIHPNHARTSDIIKATASNISNKATKSIDNILSHSDMLKNGKIAKFFSNKADILSVGQPEKGYDRLIKIASHLALVGAIGAFSFTITPGQANAMDRKTETVLGVIGGIVGGVGAKMLYDNMQSPDQYRRQAPAYMGYNYRQDYQQDRYSFAPQPMYRQNQGYSGMNNPIRMSDEMTLAMKVIVANNVGSIKVADDLIDNAIRNGLRCAASARSYGTDCVIRTQGMTMDFINGRFQANYKGRTLASESNGVFNEHDVRKLKELVVGASCINQANLMNSTPYNCR